MTIRAQLNHLGLYTSQMETMERFYREVIGLIVTDRGVVPRLGNVDIVFMSANPGSHHQIGLIGKEGVVGPSCINQIAFKLESLGDLRTIHGALRAAGVEDITTVDHGNAWSVYTSDPDGNGIELYVDTVWHVAQPHSRKLDFARSDDEIAAETERAVRTDPSFKPMDQWRAEFEATL